MKKKKNKISSEVKEYDHLKIEKKWQSTWAKRKAYKTENKSKKKKHYVLDMFPYPSGTGLHVGHPKGYIGSDVYARMRRMQGYNVLHPMGYDAFGLPAEQYALEHHIHPRKAVLENVRTFESQLNKIGLSYDWDRRVNTTDPGFYKWTQWIFLQIYESWYNKDKNKAERITELVKRFEKNGNVPEFTALEWKQKTEKDKQEILMKYRLAYEGFSEVNWCPVLGTVLANDEVVDSPKGPVSERGGFPVVKREMRQWFLRITAYADRLLTGLDSLNWSPHIKEIQRNWIGKSVGAEISFQIIFRYPHDEQEITVFTTRPDTLFGATYMVLSPEHLWVTSLIKEESKGVLDNRQEVKQYVEKVKLKTFEERTDVSKEKTGIELLGVKALNPANGEKIPIWVADYVLAGYGTGAIMAVPAHDERDFEFAKKFNLPVKQVIIPNRIDHKNPHVSGKKLVFRNAVLAIVRNPKTKKILLLNWKKQPWTTFVMGGVEEGESPIEAAKREVLEETGYKNLNLVRILGGPTQSNFFAAHKDVNRIARTYSILFELQNEERQEVSLEEKLIHEVSWVGENEISADKITHIETDLILERIRTGKDFYIGDGIVINSGKFNDLTWEQAKKEITKEVGGKVVTKYKMRDAIFARQRYWGEPIPLKYDKEGIIHELKASKLPLKLPEVKSYEPTGTGESPLAGVKAWVKQGYETNTMPGWAGSSWYFLRYMDPKDKKFFASKKAIDYWKNVDMYVGGQEHATGHLLYSRFWHKFLKDYGLVVTEEPFQTLKNQGLILGVDGRKMSKRWGNVINPDDVVEDFGADTLRVYEMFMGPFDGSLPWSTDNIVGSRRFLERIWRLSGKVSKKAKNIKKFESLLHKTVKKVGEDIEGFAFNTAVSAMMILINEMEKIDAINKADFEIFLKILSPFAPHITEEIWNSFGHKSLLVLEKWPKADSRKMFEAEVKVVVQINSKVRAEALVPFDSNESEVVSLVKDLPDVSKWLLNKEITKTVFIPNRLINFVIV